MTEDKMHTPSPKEGLLVIADDLTGANDTGVALVALGMRACVQFDVCGNSTTFCND